MEFKVNCERLEEVAKKFDKRSEEIRNIMYELQKTKENIDAILDKKVDVVGHDFYWQFDFKNQKMSMPSTFLKNNSALLKKAAEVHDELDKDYGQAMSS